MPVSQTVKQSGDGYESWKRWVSNWRRNVCSDDDATTASDGPFQTWAAATGKARLSTVNSLMGCTTKRLVLADSRARRLSRSATATRGPSYRGALSCSTSNVRTASLYCTHSGTCSQCSVANASMMRSQVADRRWVVPLRWAPTATNAPAGRFVCAFNRSEREMHTYSTVSLVPPISTMDVWRCITLY